MDTTSYDVLFDGIFSKLKDYTLKNVTEEEAKDILQDYIRPAIVKFRSCKKDLKNRDENLRQFNFVLGDDEIEILSYYMTIEYIDANYIKVPTLLKASLSSKDFNIFSNANHLRELMNMRDVYKKEVSQLVSIYSYQNSTLFTTTRPETEEEII